MSDIAIDDTLKSVLESATGYSCYPIGTGLNVIPRVTYQIIGEHTPNSHAGGISQHATNFQIGCVAKNSGGTSAYKLVKQMHNAVRTAILNKTNFPSGAKDIGRHLEDTDEKDNSIFYCLHEYQIRWLE